MRYFLQLYSNQILCQFVSMYLILTLALPPQQVLRTPKGTSDYKNKLKILVNITGDVLDLYCIDYHTPPPFEKIKHSFILTQNTSKGLNRGLKFFGPFSQKSALSHRNVPFLANIERCSRFLEYALHALIYSKKKSYICK